MDQPGPTLRSYDPAARTTPLEAVAKKSDGLSIFLVDIKSAMDSGMALRPIQNMVNHETNELFLKT